jgi:hypothetical protein
MKKELLVITASLALVGSMAASVNNSAKRASDNLQISQTKLANVLFAREKEPGDDRQNGKGKGRKGADDPQPHKFAPQVAREKEPGDDHQNGKGKGRKGLDDPKPHKVTVEVAREKEPGDDRGGQNEKVHHHRGRGKNNSGKGSNG